MTRKENDFASIGSWVSSSWGRWFVLHPSPSLNISRPHHHHLRATISSFPILKLNISRRRKETFSASSPTAGLRHVTYLARSGPDGVCRGPLIAIRGQLTQRAISFPRWKWRKNNGKYWKKRSREESSRTEEMSLQKRGGVSGEKEKMLSDRFVQV